MFFIIIRQLFYCLGSNQLARATLSSSRKRNRFSPCYQYFPLMLGSYQSQRAVIQPAVFIDILAIQYSKSVSESRETLPFTRIHTVYRKGKQGFMYIHVSYTFRPTVKPGQLGSRGILYHSRQKVFIYLVFQSDSCKKFICLIYTDPTLIDVEIYRYTIYRDGNINKNEYFRCYELSLDIYLL